MKYRLNGEEFNNQRDYRKALKESEEEKNAYDLWSEVDDSKLVELSAEDEMSVSELADYFKRTDSGIISRLVKLVGTNEIRTTYHSNGLKKEESFYKNETLCYATRWFKNGQIESHGNYLDSEGDEPYKIGFWNEWYEDGSKKLENGNSWYQNGNKKTETTYGPKQTQYAPQLLKSSEWYENGQKKSEEIYKTGFSSNLPLISIEWYENGQQKFDENFKTGKLIEWYENGHKKIEGTYHELLFTEEQFKDRELNKEELRIGKWTEWFENSNIKIEGSYDFDEDVYHAYSEYTEKVGEWIEWHENGQKKETIDYKERPFNHPKKLEFASWHENGQKKEQGTLIESISNYIQVNFKEGIWNEWYENGQKKLTGNYNCTFHGSYRDGNWTEWYENGQKKNTGNYDKLGHKEGKWLEWYKSGQKKFDGSWKETERLDGLCIEWDKNGNKVLERYYENIQDDELDYRYIEWHENQDRRAIKIQHEVYTRKNTNVSKTIEWYENGQKKLESTTYKPEQKGYKYLKHLNEKRINFYKNGQKKSHGVYEIYKLTDWPNWLDYFQPGYSYSEYKRKNPAKKGYWEYWFNNGQKKSEGEYKVEPVEYTGLEKSKKDGIWIEWNLDGQIKSTLSFKNGIKDTSLNIFLLKIIHRYDNGQIKSEENYKNDLKDGLWTTWWEKGNISTQGRYINDKKDGEWLVYYLNGQLSSKTIWEHGVQLSNDDEYHDDIPF